MLYVVSTVRSRSAGANQIWLLYEFIIIDVGCNGIGLLL